MTTIGKEELDSLIQSEWDYLELKKGEWSLLEGKQDMEVLEHVLRCILHLDKTQENLENSRNASRCKTRMAAGLKNPTPIKPRCGSLLL